MRLDYTDYARRRMATRRVSEAEVEYVLMNFVQHRRSRDKPKRYVYTARPAGRLVSVVVEEGTDPLVVVTVWGDRP